MNLKSYLYLAIFAFLSWWLVNLTGLDENKRIQAPPHSADYFSKGYTKWEMDKLGLLKNKLLAEEIRHFSDDGTTHMIKPLFYSYNENSPPWTIQSETGLLSADSKNLLLNGKVTIDRVKSAQARSLTITTSDLKVQPETSYAVTDKWAELISPPNRTTGIGMKLVYAKPIHLELLSQVQGKYETK